MKTGVKVCDAMTQQPIVLSPDSKLAECAKQMAEHRISAVLIKEKHKLVGILSDKDIVRKLVAENKNPLEMRAKDIMHTNLYTTSPEHDIFDALIKMGKYDINHLPVVDGEKLLGLLTVKDILKIQPQLFELLVDKFEIREAERKPINKAGEKEGICQMCGEYAEELFEADGSKVCGNCKE